MVLSQASNIITAANKFRGGYTASISDNDFSDLHGTRNYIKQSRKRRMSIITEITTVNNSLYVPTYID